jgi:DnaJ-class molecular chaperone
MPADFYRVLQIDPDAEPEVVAAAYRKLAAKYHPDVNRTPEAADRMREINVAYDTLGDPYKRAEYDRAKSPRWALPGGGAGGAVPETAPRTTIEQMVRTLVFMAVSSVIFSLVARAFAGPQGMTVALLIILALVLWKGNTIMRYFGRR